MDITFDWTSPAHHVYDCMDEDDPLAPTECYCVVDSFSELLATLTTELTSRHDGPFLAWSSDSGILSASLTLQTEDDCLESVLLDSALYWGVETSFSLVGSSLLAEAGGVTLEISPALALSPAQAEVFAALAVPGCALRLPDLVALSAMLAANPPPTPT